MKIHIRNRSNKKRSKKAMQELKDFAADMVIEFGLEADIDLIKITYKPGFYGYYPKGKPLGGFKKLYNNRIVTIEFTKFWDGNQDDRREAIVHELTHVKQMAEKRLIISDNMRELEWRGKPFNWRVFSEEKYAKLSPKDANQYIRGCYPWENEVHKNIEKYVGKYL